MLLTGYDARFELENFLWRCRIRISKVTGLCIGIEGYGRYRFHSFFAINGKVAEFELELISDAYQTPFRPERRNPCRFIKLYQDSIGRTRFGQVMITTDMISLYTEDFPIDNAGAGSGEVATNNPGNGETNMSNNTTKKLFQIADINIGATVRHNGEEYLVVGLKGFYNNQSIGRGFSSEDPTAVPPTDKPSIRYAIVSLSGAPKLVKKSEVTVIRDYTAIKEKYALGTETAYRAAKVEIEQMKNGFVRTPAPAPRAFAPAPVASVPAATRRTVTVVNPETGDSHTLSYTSIEELSEKVANLAG